MIDFFSLASLTIFSSFARFLNWIFSSALARKERGFDAVAGATACTAGAGCGVGVGVGGGSTGAGAGGGFCGPKTGGAEMLLSDATGLVGPSGDTGGIVGVSEMLVLAGIGSVGVWVGSGATTGADCDSAGVCAGSGWLLVVLGLVA